MLSTAAKPGKWELGTNSFRCAKGVYYRMLFAGFARVMTNLEKNNNPHYAKQ
jgi:hypothetical protein